MDTNLSEPVCAHVWKFSLKQLLLLIGLACPLLVPAYYFGGIYIFSVICSLMLIAFCASAYRKSPANAVAVAFFGLVVGFFFTFVAFTIGVHAFINLPVCLVLALTGVRPRRFVSVLVIVMFAAYALALYPGIVAARNLARIKANTPFVSLVDRLAFENSPTSAAATTIESIPLTPAVVKRLDDQDGRLYRRRHDRAWALEQLHEQTAQQFARAAGFGISRMPYVTAMKIELQPRMPLSMPAPVTISPINSEFASLSELHNNATYNFVDPNRMGYVRSRREVSGFESHGLSSLVSDDYYCAKRQPDWEVTRLELVSLLRHDERRVYVAKSLPEMDKLAEVPTRELNSFELAALPKLATQQDAVVNPGINRIEMLGALRAGNTCLECHQGPRGKLLGAFSYELVPIKGSSSTAADQVANVRR
jgi:hypothetical protein